MDANSTVIWSDVLQAWLGQLGPRSSSRTVLRRYYTLVSGGAPERRCSARGVRCLLVGVCVAIGLVALVSHFNAQRPLGAGALRPVGYSLEADTVESLSENIHIQSHQSGKCLDWSDQIVMAADCDTSKEKQKWTYVNQMIEVPFGRCMDDGGDAVHIWPCANGGLVEASQRWRFDPVTGRLQDGDLLESHCLQLDTPDSPFVSSISMQPCDEENEQQKWTFNAGPMVLTVPPTTTTTSMRPPKTSTASSTAPWTKPWQKPTAKKSTSVASTALPFSTAAVPNMTTAAGEITVVTTAEANTSVTTESPTTNKANVSTSFIEASTTAEAQNQSLGNDTTSEAPTSSTPEEQTTIATTGAINNTNQSLGKNATSEASNSSEEQTTTAATGAINNTGNIVTTTGARGGVPITGNSNTSTAAEHTSNASAALGSTSTEPRTPATTESTATNESTPNKDNVSVPVGLPTGSKASPTTTEEQTTTFTSITVTTITTTTVTTITTTSTTTTVTKKQTWQITKDGLCLVAGKSTAFMGSCNVSNGTEKNEETPTWTLTSTGHLMSTDRECLEDDDGHLLLGPCKEHVGQEWSMEEHNSNNAINGTNDTNVTNITHIKSGHENCLTYESKDLIEVSLEPCSPGEATQEWKVVPSDEQVKEIAPANIFFGFLMAMGIIACVAVVFGLLVPCAKGKKSKKAPSTALDEARSLPLAQEPPMAPPSEIPPQQMEYDYHQLHPKPRQVLFADPRPNAYHEIGICAFSDRQLQGSYDVLESKCGCEFLGNSFVAEMEPMEINGHPRPVKFTNAEAAFQALRFPQYAQTFATLSGEEALQRAREFSSHVVEDPEHGGYGTSWKAMHAVLKAKFKVKTPLGTALEQTGDDFLLCHSYDHDPNAMWSNGADGQGTNWLGMQLMLIRSNRTGWKRWTAFIQSQVDTLTGRPLYNCRSNHFQRAVEGATEALKAVLRNQDALPSIDAAPSGPAGRQREIMLGASGMPAEQQRDVLPGRYDQFYAQADYGDDLLQHRQEQYPNFEDDEAFNGATLNGATPGQDYHQQLGGQPRSSGGPFADHYGY